MLDSAGQTFRRVDKEADKLDALVQSIQIELDAEKANNLKLETRTISLQAAFKDIETNVRVTLSNAQRYKTERNSARSQVTKLQNKVIALEAAVQAAKQATAAQATNSLRTPRHSAVPEIQQLSTIEKLRAANAQDSDKEPESLTPRQARRQRAFTAAFPVRAVSPIGQPTRRNQRRRHHSISSISSDSPDATSTPRTPRHGRSEFKLPLLFSGDSKAKELPFLE